MNENREKRIVVDEVPIEGRRVVESSYNSVVSDRRTMSGVAIAALVLATITAAVVLAMLIVYNQRDNTDEELERERAIAAAAQQPSTQQPSNQPQPPVVVTVPPSQPATVPVPSSTPAPSQSATPPDTTPSSTNLEIEITSRLLNDQQLRSHMITVRVATGTATLSGTVPDEGLKTRAEIIAKTVNGIQRVINNITVQP